MVRLKVFLCAIRQSPPHALAGRLPPPIALFCPQHLLRGFLPTHAVASINTTLLHLRITTHHYHMQLWIIWATLGHFAQMVEGGPLAQTGPNGQSGPNGPKCPGWPRVSQNVPNCTEWPKWPRVAQNGPMWPKLPRVAQIAHSRLVDHPTQLICIWIFICQHTKKKRHSRVIC